MTKKRHYILMILKNEKMLKKKTKNKNKKNLNNRLKNTQSKAVIQIISQFTVCRFCFYLFVRNNTTIITALNVAFKLV